MARAGYLILDSDLQMKEPDDLWAAISTGLIGRMRPVSSVRNSRNSPTIPTIRATQTSSREWRCTGLPFRRAAKCAAAWLDDYPASSRCCSLQSSGRSSSVNRYPGDIITC
jgi:hypothetical protein